MVRECNGVVMVVAKRASHSCSLSPTPPSLSPSLCNNKLCIYLSSNTVRCKEVIVIPCDDDLSGCRLHCEVALGTD